MSANSEGYYEEVRSILNGILTTSLKGNPYLEKAILTGIQRIAKENIFSGLNNLIVCTVQDTDYDDCFGFTEEEVKELPSYHDLKDENSYHMMMLGMCAFLRRDYDIKSNRESGSGRSDICLYAKHDRYPNLVLEFKYTKDEKEDLEGLAGEVLKQIKEKKYDAEMTGEVHYVGLAHCGKKVCVRWE